MYVSLDLIYVRNVNNQLQIDAFLFCDSCRWSSTDVGWTRSRGPEDKEKLLARVQTVIVANFLKIEIGTFDHAH